MNYLSINPLTFEHNFQILAEPKIEILQKIEANEKKFSDWRSTALDERLFLIQKLGDILEAKKMELAKIISKETGKKYKESLSEIEKCAITAKTISQNYEQWHNKLVNLIESDIGYVTIEPLGGIFGIMPWNFPFWQVIRFCLLPLALGNTILIKHAPNVPLCALALVDIFREAGFDDDIFTNLFAEISDVETIISHPHIQAVSFTGSTAAGRKVAEICGRYLKKVVLELGGSDAFIVFDDANFEKAVESAIHSRLINSGQSCVAAKRFIVHKKIYNEFLGAIKYSISKIKNMQHFNDSDMALAPLARRDLKMNLKNYVELSKSLATNIFYGSQMDENCFHPIVILEFDKLDESLTEIEFFGPVFSFFQFQTTDEAAMLANNSAYGLGASVWSCNQETINAMIKELKVGVVAINSIVRSDVNFPFGGVKLSGYGRELSPFGILEFANIKTVFTK